jgi:tyrosinase
MSHQASSGTSSRPVRRRSLLQMVGAAAALVAGGRIGASTLAQTPVATPAVTSAYRVRTNAKDMTAEEKFNFTNAIKALKRKPSPWVPGLSTYDTFVLWHRDAFTCGLNAAHMGPAFFPWHRQYLMLFEEQLRSVDPTVSLVYWDWTVDQEPDSYLWQPDLMGGDGSDDDNEAVIDGPFAKGSWVISVWDHSDEHQLEWITRDLGMGGLAPDLPTAEQLEATLAIPTYDTEPWSALSYAGGSFRNSLEGWRDCVVEMCSEVDGVGPGCTGDHAMHNRVHLWVSGEWAFAHEQSMDMEGHATPMPADDDMVMGTMAANTSPNDPVFWLHHTNIDRIWSMWMERHGPQYLPESGGPLGHNIDDLMWPYEGLGIEATPRRMLDTKALGYVYDTDPA